MAKVILSIGHILVDIQQKSKNPLTRQGVAATVFQTTGPTNLYIKHLLFGVKTSKCRGYCFIP